MKASIVIPTRNRAARLRACLESLVAQDLQDFEVIVVDNASEDETEAVAHKRGLTPFVRYLRLSGARGPAVARNVGWRAAQGELVVFTDDDVVARPGWLATLIAAHERDPDAVVQGRTEIDPREAPRLGAFGRSQQVTSGPGPWFQTCNIAYPRALLERLGGFDESFTDASGEDTDLGWRALEAGTRVVFEPTAIVWHAVHDPGALALVRASQRWREGVRNIKRHPQLRDALHRGVFWKPSHERLLIAVAAGALARRAPGPLAAAVLGAGLLPYLALHRAEHGSLAGTAVALPAHVALDGAEVLAMLRGSAVARTLVV
jgi:GT2 family glycosyltransferase